MSNVLIVHAGGAKHVFIDGVKLTKVRSIDPVGDGPTLQITMDTDTCMGVVATASDVDDVASKYFADKLPPKKLTAKAETWSLQQLYDHGWTDEVLVEYGFMEPPPQPSIDKPVQGCAYQFSSRHAQNEFMSGGYFSTAEALYFGAPPQDMTIRQFQTNLPWSIKYSEDFRRNPQSHKDFAHALTHVHKAAGALSAFVDDMDHNKDVALCTHANREEYTKYIADMVICAMRMANTFPGGVIDLQNAVKDRIETKNGVTL